jgi:hypothetical protein
VKRIISMAIVLSLYACAGKDAQIFDKLDTQTGVTITYSRTPLIFYVDNSGQAAYARDLLHVGPLEVNRMGEFRYYLWLGIWNTLQDPISGKSRDGFEAIVIYADGEPLPLEVTGWSPASIGASEAVYSRPVSSSADAYYEVTVDQLRLIAASGDIRIATTGTRPQVYEPWDAQQSAKLGLKAFLKESVY